MDDHPVPPGAQARPPVAPGCVEVDSDEHGPYLAFGAPEYVTTEQLRIRYTGDDYSWAVHDRLYPQLRELIRDTLDQLRDELRELDPRLVLTSVND